MSLKATTGRPLRFRSARAMELHINEYFKSRDDSQRPYTITGLALHLGISDTCLANYEGRDEFVGVVKAAKQRIKDSVEQIMLSGKAQAGSIFWLKNHGWHDKQEIDVNDVSRLSRDELIERVKSIAGISLVAKPKGTTDNSKIAA